MARNDLGTIRDVARRIIEISASYYSEELLGLIPGTILNKMLTDNNLHDVSIEIDQLRFQKQNELLHMRGIFGSSDSQFQESIWQELGDIINDQNRFGELPPDQQQHVKEIKFLNNVALTVLHR